MKSLSTVDATRPDPVHPEVFNDRHEFDARLRRADRDDNPSALSDGWRVAMFEDVGSIAIERHGRLVLDDYFYGCGPNLPHDVRSAGKSVTTLIVGRAITETGTFSAGSRVLPLIPQYRNLLNGDARKGRMTVANLMTMASGLAYDDNDDGSPGNEDTIQSRPSGTDWYRYTLDLPMTSKPGTRALYCSAGINLLGAEFVPIFGDIRLAA